MGLEGAKSVPLHQGTSCPECPLIPELLLEHPLCIRKIIFLTTPALDWASISWPGLSFRHTLLCSHSEQKKEGVKKGFLCLSSAGVCEI